MVTVLDLKLGRDAAHSIFNLAHNFLAKVCCDADFCFASQSHTALREWAYHIDVEFSSLESNLLLHYGPQISLVEAEILESVAHLDAVSFKGLTFASAHQAALYVCDHIGDPFLQAAATDNWFDDEPSAILACLRELAVGAKVMQWEHCVTSGLLARVDREFGLACRLARAAKPQDAPLSPSHPEIGSAPKAHEAHGSKKSGKKLPSDPDLRDLIAKVKLEENSGRKRVDIAREITGEVKGRSPMAAKLSHRYTAWALRQRKQQS